MGLVLLAQIKRHCSWPSESAILFAHVVQRLKGDGEAMRDGLKRQTGKGKGNGEGKKKPVGSRSRLNKRLGGSLTSINKPQTKAQRA